MRERGFSVGDLRRGLDEKAAGPILAALETAEVQAALLARLFANQRYLPPHALLKALKNQPLGGVDLNLVAAYLTGYLAAETIDSLFDVSLFGEMSIGLEDKSRLVGTALSALIHLINESGEGILPDRQVGTRRRLIRLQLLAQQARQEELDVIDAEPVRRRIARSRPKKARKVHTKTGRKK